jgi:polyisoprenoid-binding protein YceI
MARTAPGPVADSRLTGSAKEMAVTTTSRIRLAPGSQPRLAVGSWRVDPAHSHASFAARVARRPVRGRLPLTGRVLIAEPVEDSTARLVARSAAVSTGSPVLDRLLTGSGFLDARTFPEISFRSELLAWVPAGWRAVGLLRIKNVDHELACVLDLDLDDTRPDVPPRITISSTWVIDPGWITSKRIPALGRRIVMTCSFSLEPDI